MPDNCEYPPVELDGPPMRLLGTGSEDNIEYSELSGRPGVVEVQLIAGPAVTWWKGLEIKVPEEPRPSSNIHFRPGNRIVLEDPRSDPSYVVAVAETYENNRTPPVIALNAEDAERGGHWIALLKAMMFGVHTERYRLPMVVGREGRILRFHWLTD